jgi:putative ABC transport system ATP-binding protein
MIRFDKVTIRFNGKTVVRDFSLSVEQGEKVVLYGDSGKGKTTLFKAILGFVPVSEGTITVNGIPATPKESWNIRKQVAYIPQNSDIGEGNVSGIIDLVFSLRENSRIAPKRDEVLALFDFFELTQEKLDMPFEDLSGGEKQRVVIITSLLLKRTIFLLDEITSALNERIKDKVIEYFLTHPEWTILAVSHNAEKWKREGVRLVGLEA